VDAVLIKDGDVKDRYRQRWVDASLDDQLWHQAMVTYRRQEEEYATVWKDISADEKMLFNLIQVGILDDDDKPWESSTRAMRHASAMVDRLWAVVEKEQIKVSDDLSLLMGQI
jgi:hypothetical protein